jgi:DNA-binding NarL/FixJ family response regulator
MSRVVIGMQNFVLGEAVKLALDQGGDFQITVAESPQETAQMCRRLAANVLLMDVADRPPWTLADRLRIRDEVKRRDPDCKIVLLVDENSDRQAAEDVKQAKRDGLIDLFLYGSTSASFLVALMDTL